MADKNRFESETTVAQSEKVIRISGYFSGSEGFVDFTLPSGWNGTNCRVVSLNVYTNESIGEIRTTPNSTTYSRVFAQLNNTDLLRVYNGDSGYFNAKFDVILIKFN